jgi:hypothetical protein
MKKIILSLLGMGLLISANSYATTVSNLKFDFRADQPIFFEPALSYFDSSGEYVLDVWAREALEGVPAGYALNYQARETIAISPFQLTGGIGAGGGSWGPTQPKPALLAHNELLNFRLTDLDPTNGFFGGNALSLISDIKLITSRQSIETDRLIFALYEDPSIGNLPPRVAPLIDTEIYDRGLNYLIDYGDLFASTPGDGSQEFSFLGIENPLQYAQEMYAQEMAASYGSITFAITTPYSGIGIQSLEFGVPVANEVPIPAAAWLFGSALAGLGVLRKKK